ncbi:hypothetical protein DFH09DRAFT_1144832 [Mycena vulgaris]|nr:hypothetical protein DFH09DRAFT_1144832 [Mycena vulgaris]
MPASAQPVTETVILHLKAGVNLENATPGSSSPEVEAFVQLTETLKTQPGFIHQFWGNQVEDSRIFVGYIDWETYEHITAFVNSEAHGPFMGLMGQVFDLDVAAPLMMFTRLTSDSVPALVAAVTEVAFFTIPTSARAAAEPMIIDATLGDHPVFTVGKSSGGAIGWVFDAKNTSAILPAGESIALQGIFGYESVDDHYRWRDTPEHAQVIAQGENSPLTIMGLAHRARFPGGHIFVPDSSMFHVKFRAI